jgi:flagellin
MSFRINTNVDAIDVQRNMELTSTAYSQSVQKLSSGLRINTAADDAAGYTISQKLTAEVNGLNQAQSNAQDGISMIQTGEGAMNETQSILQRMNELAVQASNGTLNSSDEQAISSELQQLGQGMDNIAGQTEFNGQNLLNSNTTVTLQVGAAANQTMTVQLKNMQSTAIGSVSGASSLSAAIASFAADASAGNSVQTDATTLMNSIAQAITDVSTQAANFGAYQNRLQDTINNLAVGS